LTIDLKIALVIAAIESHKVSKMKKKKRMKRIKTSSTLFTRK